MGNCYCQGGGAEDSGAGAVEAGEQLAAQAAAVPNELMQSLAESADPDPESTHDAGWEYVASLPAGHGAIFRRAEGAGGSSRTTDRWGRPLMSERLAAVNRKHAEFYRGKA